MSSRCFADLTDVTLADEDIKSIGILWGGASIHEMVPSIGQICDLQMVPSNGQSGAMRSLNLIQVTESISGSVVPLAIF